MGCCKNISRLKESFDSVAALGMALKDNFLQNLGILKFYFKYLWHLKVICYPA